MNSLILKIASLFLFVSFSDCYSQKATLTFNVDMNGTGFYKKDTTLNVRIKGDVEPLNWVTGIKMTDEDNDGIYATTINFTNKEKKEVTFKYVLNNVEWEGGDNLKTKITQNAKPYNSSFRYVKRPGNPFQKFIGEWTLKNDDWEQGYGKDIEHVKIPNHHTRCVEVNTDNSLLWVIEAPSSKGHIFWSYNHDKKEVQWSSSFYSYRSGVGNGSLNANGDVTFKVSFEGEPEGTYRLYTYKWISDQEYELKSIQYNEKGEPTGGFYGGTFVKINKK
jgi:hypothetical protein